MSNSPPSSIFQREHLRHAASDNLLVICTCSHCRHREAYVATDLLLVYGDMPLENFGRSSCGRCGGVNCVSAHSQFASQDDVGRLQLERPAGWSKQWAWRKEWLELPLRGLPEDIDTGRTRSEVEKLATPPRPPKFEDWTKPVGSEMPQRPRRR